MRPIHALRMRSPSSGGGGGGGAPTFVAAGTFVSNSGAPNAPWPTHQVDDIGILLIMTQNEAVPATPTGCTSIFTPVGVGAVGGWPAVRLHAYWIRATSTSMPAINLGDSGLRNSGVILTFRGCAAAGNPVDAVATDTAASSASVTVPGLTTTGANRLVVAVCGYAETGAQGASSHANASLTGLTEVFDNFNDVGGSAAYGVKAAAGAVSATTMTLLSASPQERLSFALKP